MPDLRRVLNVIHYPVFGGPHNQALRIAAPLRARGWETHVLLPDEPGGGVARLVAGGVDVTVMPLHRLRATLRPAPNIGLLARLVPEVLAIRRLIREAGIDVVQVSGLVNPHAAIAARMASVPVVWQLLDTRAPLPLAVLSMGFVRFWAAAVMSTGMATALQHPGIRRVRPRLFPYFPPVDTSQFRPRPEERTRVRREWGVPDDSPVIGCVANLNPQKGILGLIEAFAKVRRQVADARLVLIGAEHGTHAAYALAARRAITAAGLSERRDVIFVGERTDVERQLAGLDLFAFAPVPRGEGISTVVLEAMASGLPVVTTDVAGLSEAVVHGETGCLVRPHDPGAMAEAILFLVADPEAAKRFGERGRSVALERFSIDSCVNAHIAAYEFAMSSRAGR